MGKNKPLDEGLDLIEAITAVVHEVLEGKLGGDKRSRIELVKFSGKDDDVIRAPDGSKVYLRCTSERRRDGEGNPTPMVLRLAGIAGFWFIPDSAVEMVALIPEDVGQALGAGYVLPMLLTPPTKLGLGLKAFWKLGAAKLLVEAAAVMFRTKTGASFGLDDDGKFILSFANGSRFEAEAGAFRFVIVDSVGIATAVVIDATGVTTQCAPGGVPTITHKIDGTSGAMQSAGVGTFTAKHPFGFLGVVAASPIAHGASPINPLSATWKVSP